MNNNDKHSRSIQFSMRDNVTPWCPNMYVLGDTPMPGMVTTARMVNREINRVMRNEK